MADHRASVLATTAATLRQVAFWGDAPPENYIAAAEQVESGYIEDCCPVCEEVRCDEGCPLEHLRI